MGGGGTAWWLGFGAQESERLGLNHISALTNWAMFTKMPYFSVYPSVKWE